MVEKTIPENKTVKRRLTTEYVYEPQPSKVEEEEKVPDDVGEDYFVPSQELIDIEKSLDWQVGSLASPYVSPYAHKRRFLDTTFGIRSEGGKFKIGNQNVTVDENSNIHLGDKMFKGTTGLWELLTRKNVDHKLVTKNDLSIYKVILELTNGHLEDNTAFNNIKTSRGAKYKDVIAKIFPPKRRGLDRWTTYR